MPLLYFNLIFSLLRYVTVSDAFYKTNLFSQPAFVSLATLPTSLTPRNHTMKMYLKPCLRMLLKLIFTFDFQTYSTISKLKLLAE